MELNIEKILKAGYASKFQIVVFEYDEFSRIRKVFASKHYPIDDVHTKAFKKWKSLNLIA